MKALMIIGIVLGALALLIALICLLPVYVYVYYDEENSLQLRYRLLWMVFGEEPDPNNPILRLVKDLTGIAKFESLGSVKKTVSSSGISYTVQQFLEVLLSLLRQVVWLLPRCRLRKLELEAICAGNEPDDTAMEYGRLCAAVYPLVGVVDRIMPINRRKLRLDLRCDFEAAKSGFSLEAVIRTHVGPVLLALWRVVLDEAKAEAARTAQPSSKNPSTKET
ncbi:MAG: hypothetical protein IJB35_04495 [Oscillospiraceae bacterium]|nr:hypothetical protein [Oscillospiraceae bacterium]